VPRLNKLMEHLSKNGYEHHVALAHGQGADILEEALGEYLGIRLHRHP
jgi:L-fucose isomerase-like protein